MKYFGIDHNSCEVLVYHFYVLHFVFNFQSPLYGISSYEWAVGSAPNAEDIQPYGDDGIIIVDNISGKLYFVQDSENKLYSILQNTTHPCRPISVMKLYEYV